MKNPIGRRHFLQSAALLPLLGQGLPGSATNATTGGQGMIQQPGTGRGEGREFAGRNLSADVVVVGGGMTGVCAALAAARGGASVVLIQDRPVLGGNSSSEVRMHIRGADVHGRPNARETGILEQLRLENHIRNPHRCASMWDLVLWESTFYQQGLTLLLNTSMTGCRTEAGQIKSIQCYQMTTQSNLEVEGSYFIDCTGDGTLGYLAGNPYRVGQEAADEFNESLAPREAKPFTMGSSLLFTARDMGRPVPFRAPEWAYSFPTDKDLDRSHGAPEYGYWWIEWGGMLDTIADDDRIREELLKILFGVWDHLKNHGDHGAQNWALDWFGMLPARRESRRLMGAYVLCQDDLKQGRIFEDEVAYGGWPIDHHFHQGFDFRGPDFWYSHRLDSVYSIPLRSLHSGVFGNLFFGGRALSATHVALGSTRVMATCAVIGQGAGTAAAYCARHGVAPGQLSAQDMERIKQTLLRDDAFLPGTPNRDPQDKARGAKPSAGSYQPGHEPGKVIDGVARTVGEDSHQWRSMSLNPEDAWLELDLGGQVKLNEVHLCLDTGLSRSLTLTHENSFNATMLEGAQPETASDYRIELFSDGSWQTVAQVEGNYQRRRVHQTGGVAASKVRLRVDAANGAEEARVFEIRCY